MINQKIHQESSNTPQYRALSFLSMLYITIILSANLLIYKLTHFGSIVVSAGTFIIPLWYILADIIAEVYGYEIIRRLIWQSLFCTLIFSVICDALIKLPSPIGMLSHQAAFNYILGNLIRIFFGMLLAVVIGSFLNAFILTKWKILLRGKFYWLRSLSSSAIGQFCFTFISLFFDLFKMVPFHVLAELIAVSYIIKLIVTPIAVIPASLIASYLKRFEYVDVYDTNTNFNPFRLEVKNTIK